MESIELTAAEALTGLRMMKAIAMADGALDEKEVSLIEAAARALGQECDARALTPATPLEVKDAVRSPLLRERALQASMIASMIDGKVSDVEVEAIASFARELEVEEPRLRNLQQLARGQIRRMWLDLARRSFAGPVFDEALKKHGIGGVFKIVAPMIGLGKDADLARRYNDLGKLDEGTLGRAYWRFIVDNELGFPGEGIVAEEGVWHDISHVLGGYEIDPAGEVQVVSFIAGYRREDPFFWLFTIALQFHLGVKVSPYSPGMVGRFDPQLVIAALRRGMAMTRDLSVDYDHWPDMPLPLDEVRAKYGVPMS